MGRVEETRKTETYRVVETFRKEVWTTTTTTVTPVTGHRCPVAFVDGTVPEPSFRFGTPGCPSVSPNLSPRVAPEGCSRDTTSLSVPHVRVLLLSRTRNPSVPLPSTTETKVLEDRWVPSPVTKEGTKSVSKARSVTVLDGF